MDRFFYQWLYHPRHPDLKITYAWILKDQLAKITIEQTQKVDDVVMLYQFPTLLRFIVNDKTVDQRIEVTKAKEDFYVPLDAQPTVVRFDPEYTVLANVAFDVPNSLLKAQIENQADMIGRLLACEKLGERKTHESLKMLEKAVNEDAFFGIRIAAANALSKHESEEAFKVLERSWKTQTDARVRSAIVSRITNRYNEETPKLIAEILDEERNPSIQATAIRALGRFHGDETRSRIVAALQTKSFRNELAVAAISAIRQQNDPSYAASLMKVLTEDERHFTSGDFGRGLETLGYVAKSLKKKDSVRDFLLKYINHPMTRIRSGAMDALGNLGDATVISVLESFVSSNDVAVARTAKRALDQLRESKPSVPKEIVELRKEVAAIKTESDQLQADLKDIRNQQKAKE